MKYIRTKDGIYEAKKNKVGAWITKLPYKIFDRDIINQADTIEELCDEFVWITPENEKHIKPKSGDGLWYLCCNYKDGHQIYGAIWTDKGLIYAAKMNDKGELELL